MKNISKYFINKFLLFSLLIITIFFLINYLNIYNNHKSFQKLFLLEKSLQINSNIEILLCWNMDIWKAAITFGFKEDNVYDRLHSYQIANYLNKKNNKLFIALYLKTDCNYFKNIQDSKCSLIIQNALDDISLVFPNNNFSLTTLATAGLWQSKYNFPKAGKIFEAIAFNKGGNICSFTSEAIQLTKKNKFPPAVVILTDSFHKDYLANKKTCKFNEKPILLSSNKMPDIKFPTNIVELRELFCMTDIDFGISLQNTLNQYKRNKKGCSNRLIKEVILNLS
mgnify:FL=1|tara:strand:- start:416 stop:1258 length:843 start_codon:yes stop_codon:yes gene_type:complete